MQLVVHSPCRITPPALPLPCCCVTPPALLYYTTHAALTLLLYHRVTEPAAATGGIAVEAAGCSWQVVHVTGPNISAPGVRITARFHGRSLQTRVLPQVLPPQQQQQQQQQQQLAHVHQQSSAPKEALHTAGQ